MMPPWESLRYFDNPSIENRTFGAGITEIVPSDPGRVMLRIRYRSGATQIGINTRNTGNVGEGWYIDTDARDFELFHYRDGPIVCAQFFANVVGPTPGEVVSIMTAVIKEWPKRRSR